MAINLSAFKTLKEKEGVNLSAFDTIQRTPSPSPSILPTPEPKKEVPSFDFNKPISPKIPIPKAVTSFFEPSAEKTRVRDVLREIPGTLKSFVAPARGFTEKELAGADTTIKQRSLALPKLAAEIGGGIISLGDLLADIKPLQKFATTPVGGKLADVGAFIQKGGEKLTKFSHPKNVEEAKALRLADVGTLFIGVGELRISTSGAKLIARSKNLKTINKIVKKEIPNISDDGAGVLSKILVEVDNTDDVQRVLNRVEFGREKLTGAGTTKTTPGATPAKTTPGKPTPKKSLNEIFTGAKAADIAIPPRTPVKDVGTGIDTKAFGPKPTPEPVVTPKVVEPTTEFKTITVKDVVDVKPSTGISIPSGVEGKRFEMFIDIKDGAESIIIDNWKDAGFVAVDGGNVWHFETKDQAVDFGRKYLTLLEEASRQNKNLVLSPKLSDKGTFVFEETKTKTLKDAQKEIEDAVGKPYKQPAKDVAVKPSADWTRASLELSYRGIPHKRSATTKKLQEMIANDDARKALYDQKPTQKEAVKEEKPVKITHFTKSENIDKILSEGFDTSLPPIHGVGGLQGGARTEKIGKDILYFTADTARWKTASIYTGGGKVELYKPGMKPGPNDEVRYNYDRQKYEIERDAMTRVDLSPIEAEIKKDASILIIDSLKSAKTYLGKNIDRNTFVEDLITKAKKAGTDILNIKDTGVWDEPGGDPTKTGFSVLTGKGGKNDYFVLNKEAITVSKKPKTRAEKIAPFAKALAKDRGKKRVAEQEADTKAVKEIAKSLGAKPADLRIKPSQKAKTAKDVQKEIKDVVGELPKKPKDVAVKPRTIVDITQSVIDSEARIKNIEKQAGKTLKKATDKISYDNFVKEWIKTNGSDNIPSITVWRKEIKPSQKQPTPAKKVSPKEVVDKTEIRAGKPKSAGKSKRDLKKEVAETVKKQGEKLKDSEIKEIREKSLLGAETIDEIIVRKRGIITDKEAIKRAKDLNLTLEEVLNIPKGTVPTKEQLTAVAQVVQAEREINKKLIQLADGFGPSSSNVERELIKGLGEKFTGLSDHEILNRALEESTLKLRKAEIVLFSMKSEAGRTLQGAKQVVDAVEGRMRIMYGKINKLDALEQQGAIEQVGKMHKNDDKAFIKFLDKYSTADFFDKFAEWSTAAKLWNPTTHAVNFGGNTLRGLVDVGLTSLVSPKTIKADMMGARAGLNQGLKNALRAMTDEGYASTLSKYIEEGGTSPSIGGKLGQWIRTPFRLLGASDEIFRGMGYQRSLYRQAAREAGGDAIKMKQMLEFPTLEMLEEATKQSKRLTFQEDMGEITKWVNKGRTPANFKSRWAKAGATLMRIFIPFLKTPTNLFKQAVDLSPVGLIKNFPEIKKLTKAGDHEHARRLIGEAIFGTALAAWVAMETLDGNITGGAPRSGSEKDRFYREKKMPYAIKIGGRWYSYQRIDPFSTVIATMANLVTLKEKDELTVGGAIISVADQLEDKTYMQGFSDLTKLLTGEQWERDYVWKSAVLGVSAPSFVGHLARTTDPKIRVAETLTERVKTQIPGVSKTLPARVNVIGQDIERANQGLNYFFNPIQMQTAELDPVTEYLASIDKTLPVPQNFFTRDGVKYELTAEEYEAYSRHVGQSMAKWLLEKSQSKVFTNRTPEKQSSKIDKERREIMDKWKDDYVSNKATTGGGRGSLESIFGGQDKTLEEIFK